MLKHAKIADGGRVVIPAAMRKRLGLHIGDEVLLDVEEGELRMRALSAAISQAQATVRQYVDKDERLSDELIQDRRREASLE